MSYTARLRLTLLLAAVAPPLLIAVIILVGLPAQIRRIESQQADEAAGQFRILLERRTAEVIQTLDLISSSQEFQLAELTLASGKQPVRYQLPMFTLDFIEYIDTGGVVLISGSRPAMTGRRHEKWWSHGKRDTVEFWYDHDRRGSHPAVAVVRSTENGKLIGGFFLDGAFGELAEALTRSTIHVLDKRQSSLSAEDMKYMQMPILYDPGSYLYLTAEYHPADYSPIFSRFMTAVAAVMVVALGSVMLISYYFSRRTARELEALILGARRVSAGEFSSPIPDLGNDEFAKLGATLNRMMVQLSEYRTQLAVSEKIAAWQSIGQKVAHEVKNPLTPIAIAVDDLTRSYAERRPDFEQILQEASRTVRHEVDRLKKLIDRFSALAKLPAPEMVRIPLPEFSRDLRALYADEIVAERLVIDDSAATGVVFCDPDQIRQALINLIKNSLESGGECTVVITEAASKWSITVSDEGPGFPEEILSEGVTPYFSTKKDGSGLGLIICQQIVHDHNGNMRLDNQPRGGARVTITLPMQNG